MLVACGVDSLCAVHNSLSLPLTAPLTFILEVLCIHIDVFLLCSSLAEARLEHLSAKQDVLGIVNTGATEALSSSF